MLIPMTTNEIWHAIFGVATVVIITAIMMFIVSRVQVVPDKDDVAKAVCIEKGGDPVYFNRSGIVCFQKGIIIK